MITAGSFLAIEASLSKLVQKEAGLVTKKVFSKVAEAVSSGEFQKAREELSLLNLGPMFAKNEKALTYLTNVAMLFGASRVTQQPGTSVVGMGFEKLATQQLVGTFLQMVRQKAEAYLIKAGTDHIDELESKALEPVQKSNPYHDELGKFTSKDKAVWFHGTSVGGSGVPEGENLRPGRDGALWLTRDPAKAVRYAQLSGEATGGEPAVFVVRDADVPQDPSNYGDDMVRASLFSPKAIGLVKVGVKKANPYHDADGEFTDREHAVTVDLSSESSREFTPEELEALKGYGTAAGTTNMVLRDLLDKRPAGDRYPGITSIDSAMKVSTMREDVTVFRGITDLRNYFEFDSEKKKFLIAPGMQIKDDAYVSTSKGVDSAAPFAMTWKYGAAAMFQIEVPKGTNGIDMDATATYFKGEKEILLDRGLTFEVVSVEKKAAPGYTLEGKVDNRVTLIKMKVASPTKKAERVLRPFESFVDEAGQAYFNMVSSLHTSRVSAYGFTAEAEVLGLEEYQINEQLDNRICPVCREMHKKTFKVADARRLLDIVTRVTDPDDLKALQPWPKQDKANLEKLKEMSYTELVANGWHIPPYHPGCRGLLGRVGKVPALDKVATGQPEKYVASKDDFKTFKLSASEKQVALWNDTVGLSPAEVFARMTGRTADELLAAALDSTDPKQEAGLYSVSIAKNITIRMTKEGFGSKNPFDQGLVFKTGQKELYIDSVELSGEDQAAGVVKKYMREIYTLAKDAGATKLGLTAGLDVGGYAWAKYGFKPTIQAWETLKKDLYAKSAKLGYQTLLPEEKSKLLNVLLSSDDPASIFTLSDTVGKELLMGSMWEGALNFTDAESVARFLGYIGELK